MNPCCPHTTGGPHSALCLASERQRGREEVLQAMSNFAEGQLVMALDETNLDARRGRLFVIEYIRALIDVESVRP